MVHSFSNLPIENGMNALKKFVRIYSRSSLMHGDSLEDYMSDLA
jgi:hypothetical protein